MGTFPNKDTQFKEGNPGGGRPKGSLSLSTHIQNLLNDEEFTLENFLFNGKTYKGAPMKAIITVAIMQSMQGEQKWADWLAKYGYGSKVDMTSNGETITPVLVKFLDDDRTDS